MADIIIEFFVEFFVEFFAELIVEVFAIITRKLFPNKNISQKAINIFAAVTGALILVSLVVGVCILIENKNSLVGVVLVAIPFIYIITALLIGTVKRRKKKKKDRETYNSDKR